MIQPGTPIAFGAPAVPMPKECSDAIARLVASIPQVVEAHLPQVYVPRQMSKPEQVLIIVFSDAVSEQALEHLLAELPNILPSNQTLDLWPITLHDELLETVRRTNCRIHEAKRYVGWASPTEYS